MKLVKFKFQNIFSLGVGEFNLKNRRLILVAGMSNDEGSSNGSGKSSLANKGIIWTLYGQTAGGLSGDSVLNRHVKGSKGSGEITFLSETGDTYRIKRSRPSKLELYQNDSDISSRKVSETQKLIDQIVGVDFKTFIQTYMFGQGRLSSFASLTPADQKDILEQLLPTNDLNKWHVYSKECVQKVNKKIEAVKIDHEAAKKGATHLIETVNSLAVDERRWREVNKADLSLQLQRFNYLKSNSTKDSVDKIATKIEQLELKIKELEKDGRIESLISKNTQEISKLSEAIGKCALEEERYNSLIYNHKLAIVKIDEDKCPTCGRAHTDPAIVKNILKENAEHEAQIEFLLKEQKEVLNKKARLTEEKITAYTTEKDLDAKARTKNHLERILQATRQHYDVASNAEHTMLSCLLKTEEIMNSVNPYTSQLKAHEERRDAELKAVLRYEQLIKNLEMEKQYLEWWAEVFKKHLKLKLLNSICGYIEAQIALYLKQLRNDQLKVQFNTVKMLASGEAKEDFNVRVYSEKGGEGFEALSGGEQQIVSFAISKALSDVSKLQTKGKCDFQILDEPFSMLDVRNCESLIEFLNNEPITTLLISNDEAMTSLVSNKVVVEKTNGVTSIVNDGL